MPRGICRFEPGMEKSGFFTLAGGPLGFDHLDVLQRGPSGMTVTAMPASELMDHAAAGGSEAEARASLVFDRMTRPRPDYAGLDLGKPVVMGIINTTPDSFSDGGDHAETDIAIAAGRKMADDGADILDIGGESTRPGADPVSREEEKARILPAISVLSKEGYCVSADTRHTAIMQVALDAGATIINDVGGLRDNGAPELVSQKTAPSIIMHMQGEPGTMQKDPRYDHVATDVYDWLEDRLDAVEESGLRRAHLAIDPGFGFGKTPQHNMEIMASLALYHGLGVPIVLGVSRKSTIGHFSKGEPA